MIVQTTKVVVTESSPEKGINGDETKEVRQEYHQYTEKRVVVTTEVNGEAGDEKSTDHEEDDGPDGELLAPSHDEPGSPTKKKGTKVKKKKSFKDALVKKFSKKGERPAKYVKNEGEKPTETAAPAEKAE